MKKASNAVLELLRHPMSLVRLKQKGKRRPEVRAAVGVPAEAFRVSKQCDDQLAKLISERHPEAQFSIHMMREWKDRWTFVVEA